MNLSKSKYCEALQCKKMLWLEINHPEVKQETSNESVLENGTEVGNLAKKLFEPYIDITYQQPLTKMVEETQEVIQKEETINITEASFLYQNNFCSVDILRKMKNKYEIYEVKSSKEVTDIYIEDVSYQYYVLKSLGYDIQKVAIVHLNTKYVRKGKLELQKLFNIVDVTEIAKEKQEEIEKQIKEINKYMKQQSEPTDTIGKHCTKPYECLFFDYCTRQLEKPNVFDIRGMNFLSKIKYYEQGIYTFKDLVKEKLNPNYLEQIEFEINPHEDKIEKDKIKEFLDTLDYPLYFLDFETYAQPIPPYDGVHPYEKIPFQYSLHYYEEKEKELQHKEFLAEPGKDPRRDLAEQLVKDIPKDVCVLAYNMSFEKSVIKSLAFLYPDLKEHLLNIHSHIKDLMIPFIKRYYYNKAMQGSYSIKYVLPALFPDDPSLNYHNLEEIHNGDEAMTAYANMDQLTKEEQNRLRENLLKYCGLDTYAMVKIYEKLQEVTKKKEYCKKM